VFQRILNDEPAIAAVPSPFREVIARCLDKDPRAPSRVRPPPSSCGRTPGREGP
jgi:hypothetical protein